MDVRTVKAMVLCLLALTVFVAILESGVDARPSRTTGWPDYQSLLQRGVEYQRRTANECDLSIDVRELCQRCAKATKSKYAYPLCCEGMENTRFFCRNFLDFSYTSSPPNSASVI